MCVRTCLLVLILGLGLTALLAPPGIAAEKADAQQIARLIEQLGSNNFEEREQASKKLADIGLPALEPLRKVAASSSDAEVRQRAEDLLHKLAEQVKLAEKQAEAARLLKVRTVHLAFKETPVAEAVKDFAKKSGYDLHLLEPENLANRKVTLDTGETTFWQAFAQFCDAAGLVEATRQELIPKFTPTPIRPRVGGGIVPPANAVPGAPPAIGIPIQPRGIPTMGVANLFRSSLIVLKNGKAPVVPTCASGAIRVRARLEDRSFPAVSDQILIPIDVRAEPRMEVQQITTLKITKAVDDQGQNLEYQEQGPGPVPVRVGVGVGVATTAVLRYTILSRIGPVPGTLLVPLRFKKGDKESTTLKELSGTLTSQTVLLDEPFATVDKILQAAGKVIKGSNGAVLRVIEVSSDKDKIDLKVEFDTPPAVGVGGPIGPGIARPHIRILPIPIGVDNVNLFDDKGQKIPPVESNITRRVENGKITNAFTLTYRPEKNQVPAKLVYSGTRTIPLAIPFTLKDVPAK